MNPHYDAMRKAWHAFLSSCVVLLMYAGCAYDPRVEEFEASVGKASQDELIRRFGYPQRMQKLATGNEVWSYEFLAGQSRCVGYKVYFDEELRSQRWESTSCR